MMYHIDEARIGLLINVLPYVNSQICLKILKLGEFLTGGVAEINPLNILFLDNSYKLVVQCI